MEDVDYCKYIIKKYIPFKNNESRNQFIYRYTNPNKKDSRTNQFVDIIIDLSKNNNTNTIVAEPIVNRVVEKTTKPKPNNKQTSQLKQQIKQLKQEIEQLKQTKQKEIEQLKQQNVNRHSKWTEQKNELEKKNNILSNQKENLEYRVKEYEELLKKYGWKPPKKDFNILDEEIELSDSDDEIQNELDRGLN